jgi:hypothetical protein
MMPRMGTLAQPIQQLGRRGVFILRHDAQK